VTDGPEAPRAIRLVRVQLPLLRAHRAAHGGEERRDLVLVEWRSAGDVSGWGECPTLSQPGYATETTDEAWAALRDRLAPAALEGAPATGAGAAAAALADAALDARLRAAGRSLREHLGGARTRLARCVVLADLQAPPATLAARAVEAIEGGARMVKVKVAPGTEVQVRTVVDAVGAARVAADANGSFADPGELRALDELGLRYLEQPVPASWAWDRIAEARAALRTPVALDESLTSLGAVRSALAEGALDVASIKPARLGGVEAAAEAARTAAASDVDAFVGGMLELGVGRAAAAAVASLEGCTLPTDLGPSEQYVARDLTDPVRCDPGGLLLVPDGPGIGRTPDPDHLAAATVDEVLLRA